MVPTREKDNMAVVIFELVVLARVNLNFNRKDVSTYSRIVSSSSLSLAKGR